MRKLLTISIIAFLTSCSTSEKKELTVHYEIAQMEAEMKKKESLDTALAHKMLDAYLNFVDENPKDSLASVYLLKAGNVYKAYPGKEEQALDLYKRIVKEYKYTAQTPEAVMSSAFIYEEMNKTSYAAASYKYMVKNFPSHPYASDAQNLLDLLTSSEEEELDQVKAWIKNSKNKQNN